ncbi:MAG: SMC-Scp complex subunit ScpB [Planctomycetota bacterium]|nr:SMC-Scp complex subunit ScpB [Planctomycetota bacterium]
MISRDRDGSETTPETTGELSTDGTSAPLEGEALRSTIEAILFASAEPVSRRRLNAMLREAPKGAVRDELLALEAELVTTGRGYILHEDGAGLRLLTKPEYAPFVARLRGEGRRIRLSSAAFETLAVIAYRQPVRRADLEAVRGVQCGPILKNLMEWNLVRVTGQEDSVGRPLLYGTTSEFLELLGLSGLDDLPEPERLREQGSDRGLEILDDLLCTNDESEDHGETSSGKHHPADKDGQAGVSELPPGENLDDWVPDGWEGD